MNETLEILGILKKCWSINDEALHHNLSDQVHDCVMHGAQGSAAGPLPLSGDTAMGSAGAVWHT